MKSPKKTGGGAGGRPVGTTRGRTRKPWSVSVLPSTAATLKAAAKRRGKKPGAFIEEILAVLQALA